MTRPQEDYLGNREADSVVHSPWFGSIALDFLVLGDAHACPYLPGRVAREEFFSSVEFDPELYHDFMDAGFRRSGLVFYRPRCRECSECRSLRVVCKDFRLTKSYRRVLRKNGDISLSIGKPRLTTDKMRMYTDYLSFQHASSRANSPEDLERFLYQTPVRTLEMEYRVRGNLVCVSIGDVCSRSLSSVYVFFDPDHGRRSLGTLSAISEVLLCQDRGIPFYYLGFYIEGCDAMNYKARFKPHEVLSSSRIWEPRKMSRLVPH
ncbi:MAG: arginyltransferase [Thermodesulfobacteriota bacterium]